MDRIFRNKDKNKYMSFAKELYEHGALDDESITKIQDNPQNIDKEKDDFEIEF